MCGIVGLHLRTPDLYPRLGELLTGMLCEMQDRGSDSAGVAVYGDPTWSPPGHATVSILDTPLAAAELAAAIGAVLGEPVEVIDASPTFVVNAPVSVEALRSAVT
ncbi:MAG: hypothetical protein ABWX74_10720, partial [Aeromicrobium sp.]